MTTRTAVPEAFDFRMSTAGTLTAWVASQQTARRIDDATIDPAVPAVSRELLSRRGFRSAILAPLLSQGQVIGTLNVTHRKPERLHRRRRRGPHRGGAAAGLRHRALAPARGGDAAGPRSWPR